MAHTELTPYQSLVLSNRDMSQPLYLLVDPLVAIEPQKSIHINNIKKLLGDYAVTVVPRCDFIHSPKDCPHLVLLAPAGKTLEEQGTQELFIASAEHAQSAYPALNRYICGWLQSTLGIESLAQELAKRMLFDKRTNQPQTQDYFISQNITQHALIAPLHQPLRLELILGAGFDVDPHAVSQWLYPVSQWIFPAVDKGLFQIKSTTSSSAALPQQAILAARDAPLVAQIIAVWLRQATKPLSAQDLQQAPLLARKENPFPEQAALLCWKALRAGRHKGLSQQTDLILFAMLRLITHPQFDTHPAINAMVVQAAQGHASFESQVANITHHQWMHCLNELNSINNNPYLHSHLSGRGR